MPPLTHTNHLLHLQIFKNIKGGKKDYKTIGGSNQAINRSKFLWKMREYIKHHVKQYYSMNGAGTLHKDNNIISNVNRTNCVCRMRLEKKSIITYHISEYLRLVIHK